MDEAVRLRREAIVQLQQQGVKRVEIAQRMNCLLSYVNSVLRAAGTKLSHEQRGRNQPSPQFSAFLKELPRSAMRLTKTDVVDMAREIVGQTTHTADADKKGR